MRLLTRLCCAMVVAFLPILSSPLTPTASASNFTVNSLADTPDALTSDGICADAGGACTLRAAIQQANADPSGDVIGFSVNGTINLTSALPDLSKSITISGPGAAQLTVRRNSAEPYRIFVVSPAVNVSISGLTVSNGQAPPATVTDAPGGGGIYNAGGLTLSDVIVSNNSVPSSPWPVPFTPFVMQGGGGIQNDGVLTMTDCDITGNSTGSGVNGNSNVSGGNGGGIFNTGTLAMTGSSVTFNATGRGADRSPSGGFAGSGGAGGGIYNAPNGARQVGATLTNCNVSENSTGDGGKIVNGVSTSVSQSGNGGAGGGVYNASTMTISSSFVSGNQTGVGASVDAGIARPAGKGGAGGGIYNDIPSGGGEMKIVNCIISGNKTGKGGVGSGLTLSEGDGGNGGGVANSSSNGVLKMSQSTIAFNQTGLMGDGGGRDGDGGGIYGVMSLRSNAVALNVVHFPTNRSDAGAGPITSFGYNFFGFFGGASCCLISTDRGSSGSQTFAAVKFDQNLIPLPGSLLIDAGLARDIDDHAVTEDIRGGVRPFDFPTVAPQTGGDDSDIGAFERQATDPTPTPTPTPTTVQFSAATSNVPEGCNQTQVTMTRSGPKDGTTVVTYAVEAFEAHQRGDFTRMIGHVTFAPGEDSKTIPVLVSEDAYAEGPENLIVFIVGVTGGQLGAPNPIKVQIDDNDAVEGTSNPIDDNATFVCQHYHDFLSRHPDSGGQAFWTAQLDACGPDAACLDRKRVDVSAAFFLSIEFQNTGYFVIRVNKAAFGDQPGNPTYDTFLDHTQQVGRGVVVGEPGYEAVLEANKRSYAEQFVQRLDFQSAHDSQSAAQYVDSLFSNAGVTPTTQERDAALSAFGAGGVAGQAAALRSVVESGSVYNKLYNPAFVLMQYFAYLRRAPDSSPDTNFDGYNFWLGKLNSVTLPGEDARDERVALARVRRAEMIRAFIRSSEYRGRFAGDPNKGN
ncbi:MAG: Calx-beta domain-containing protein [Pyrinomonadaceae bacterium]